MPANTPKLAIPYPLPADAVTDYPTTGQQLANRLEALLQQIGELSYQSVAGAVTINTSPDIANAVELIPSASAPTVTYDGSPCMAEFLCLADLQTAGQSVSFVLWEAIGAAPWGLMGIAFGDAAGSRRTFYSRLRFTPPAGQRRFYVRGFRGSTASAPVVSGGAANGAGSQNWPLMYLRVQRAGSGLAPSLEAQVEHGAKAELPFEPVEGLTLP